MENFAAPFTGLEPIAFTTLSMRGSIIDFISATAELDNEALDNAPPGHQDFSGELDIDASEAYDRLLTVADVAAILSVSDDTVLKQFGSLEGVIDIGAPATMHKRRKRVLRIPRRTLEKYLADKQVKLRRS